MNRFRANMVRDHYQDALHEIMSECDIRINDIPDYEIEEDTSFEDAVRYTEYFTGRTHDERLRPDGRRNDTHFRYNRYSSTLRESLVDLPARGRRVAHLDIGCGSGMFSWVLLDWATMNGIDFDRVDLYGYDHSPAMISLAEKMKDKLALRIVGYPNAHYSSSLSELSLKIEENSRAVTDYIVTFGYVLVQAHSSQEIQKFTQVIDSVASCLDGQSNCMLVAVDSRKSVLDDREGIKSVISLFSEGWNLLLKNLEQTGIQLSEVTLSQPVRNYPARCAKVYPK